MRRFIIFVAGALVLATGAFAAETITYSYDASSRLVRVEHVGTINNNVVSNYSFDDADNRNLTTVTGAP